MYTHTSPPSIALVFTQPLFLFLFVVPLSKKKAFFLTVVFARLLRGFVVNPAGVR